MAKFKIKSKGVLPPITSNKETLQVQFAITVPSTVLNREVKSEVFKKRADDVARYLADSFGGDTKVRGKGDYTSKGKLITDNVFIIEASSLKYSHNPYFSPFLYLPLDLGLPFS